MDNETLEKADKFHKARMDELKRVDEVIHEVYTILPSDFIRQAIVSIRLAQRHENASYEARIKILQ